MGVDDHAKKIGKNQAKLERDTEYRSNGYRTIKGDGGRRERYGRIPEIQDYLLRRNVGCNPLTDPAGRLVTPGSVPHARRYTFKYGPNFKIAGSPYPNQAHHLLPVEALQVDPYLTAEQREILLQVKYDINNGKNIIFLPEARDHREIHKLPSHCGSHPKYTRIVAGDMKEVRAALNKGLETDPEHKNYSPQDIKSQLHELQSQYWTYLTTCPLTKINRFKKPKGKGLGPR